jgi:hypothetical protein
VYKAINDRGEALIESLDAQFNATYVFYSRGRTSVLSFGAEFETPTIPGIRVLNNHGAIAGVQGDPFVDARGFLYDTRSDEATRLEPQATELLSWAMGINNRGDVLGYSFSLETPESAYVERVGIWDRRGKFKTYYVANESSESILFNDDNLIVITRTKSRNSYIVPKPGTQLNLTEVVRDLPANTLLPSVMEMNNHGDMIGVTGAGESFLLEQERERCGRP